MTNDWFLWPESNFLNSGLSLECSVQQIEEILYSYFPGSGHPVLVSSGRAGLVLALEALGVDRSKTVGLFPYASHCVIEAVSRIGSPVCGPQAYLQDIRIIYHQWGYVQEQHTSDQCIEDAVDSFVIRGSPLFPAGSNLEIWSLSKLLGVLGGGILWCRHEDLAAKIRDLRNARRAPKNLIWLLKLFSKKYPQCLSLWHGIESLSGVPPVWGCASIMSGLRNWEKIEKARLQRLSLLRQYLVPWLIPLLHRIPTAIPVDISTQQAQALGDLGFKSGFRHFEQIKDFGDREVIRVFPIPIHQGIPMEVLEKTQKILSRR